MSVHPTRRDLLLAGAMLAGLAPARAPAQSVGGAERAARRSRIIAACARHWPGQTHNCSGFVKAVAADLGITLTGQANDIYDQIHQGRWTRIGTGPNATDVAALTAVEGNFVVGASRAADNGHVAIIVDYRDAPVGFWGSMRSVGGKEYAKITESWGSTTMEGAYFAFVDF